MTPQEHYDKIWAVLQETAERMDKAEQLAKRQHEQAMQRMAESERRAEEFERRADRRHEKAMLRHEKAEQRLDRAEIQIQATRKLVQEGIKLVLDIGRRQKAAEAETAELKKSTRELQIAFRAWLRNGHNGRGHNGSAPK